MPPKRSGSATAIIGRVRQLQRLRAERLAPTAKPDSREVAKAAAEASGIVAPLFPEYFGRPVEFATEQLGLRLCKAQRKILISCARHKRVAIRSGQKTGKSTAFVAAALWWAATRRRGRVLFTGPGNAQVRDVLWKELRRVCYDTANTRPDGKTVVQVLGIEPALMPHTGMQWPDGREILGAVRESPTATQGFSGPEVLIIIDEASGVPDDIFAAHEGNTAAGGHILAASNPTSNIGWFYEAFHSQAEFWETHHFKSTETPNVTGEEPAIPGLADSEWVAQQLAKNGPGHPEYEVRVLGNFAGTSISTVIGLALVDEAIERWKKANADEAVGVLELGVDVARFGDDDTAIAPRRGRYMYPLEHVNGADGNAVAALVMQVVRRLRRDERRVVVKIDCTGGFGSSPADILRANYSNEVTVVEINVSRVSDDEERYTNLRAQLHFGMKQWLAEGGELPPDAKLKVELLAPKYGFDGRHRYKVESKDEIKKRIKRSPDRGDAAQLAVYGVAVDPPQAINDTKSRWEDDARGYG